MPAAKFFHCFTNHGKQTDALVRSCNAFAVLRSSLACVVRRAGRLCGTSSVGNVQRTHESLRRLHDQGACVVCFCVFFFYKKKWSRYRSIAARRKEEMNCVQLHHAHRSIAARRKRGNEKRPAFNCTTHIHRRSVVQLNIFEYVCFSFNCTTLIHRRSVVHIQLNIFEYVCFSLAVRFANLASSR